MRSRFSPVRSSPWFFEFCFSDFDGRLSTVNFQLFLRKCLLGSVGQGFQRHLETQSLQSFR